MPERRPLQAIVLAAGYGRRMSPLSDSCHKALLPLGGTTILGRILDSLRDAGVSSVLVVTGYRAQEVEEFIAGNDRGLDVRCLLNERYSSTNNITSLALALEHIDHDSDVLLIECDLIFDTALLRPLVERTGNVALVDHYREGMDGTVVAVKDGLVTALYTPSAQDADFTYRDKYKTLNIYRFDQGFCNQTLAPSLARYADEVDPNAYYETVLGQLIDLPTLHIEAQVVSGEQWAEVDDPNDLRSARFVFEPDRRAELLDRAHGGHWNFEFLDFAHIRNARFPTPAMLAALAHALPTLVASYGSAQPLLNQKLSWFLRADPGRIHALNGASQALPILARHLSDLEAAVPTPAFGEYARLFPGARTYADAPGINAAELRRMAGEVDLVVIVNPNNPTGSSLPVGDLHELAASHPDTTFLVDESFQPFSGEPSLLRLLEVDTLPNVIVVASLGKSLGVPGLRLGYMYCCDSQTNERFGQELPIWNLNAPAEFLLELLLKFQPELRDAIEHTIEDRELLRHQLGRLEITERVHPSAANFLLVELSSAAPPASAIREALLLGSPAINVRDASGRFGDGRDYLRIAVRTPEENDVLVSALSRMEPQPR